MLEVQQDHSQLMLQYKNDQQQDHNTVVAMIRELTTSVKSLSAMINIDKKTSPTDKSNEEIEADPYMVTPMQTKKEQHKRKDGYTQVSNTHRKTRSKITLE